MADISVYQIPKQNFKIISGTPKTWTKRSDFDREITNHFCATCGTVLFRSGGNPNVQDCIGLRAGVLDDQNIINETVPKIEVFPERRPKWRNKIEGAIQLKGQVEILEDEYWNKDGTPKSTGVETNFSPNGRDLSSAEF
ncbi:hypothetical protein CKM354_000698900 [Cercospora kikuchii]|uniref:CENP-V/GFA domain-containing protein n=1 Tax=Cercospora kikuchii TaxID=84275 RepID=A0A9P3CJ41_9PEZI|nr:uncharacterized protein CKM354_000698900 [Cercospora kikuchii]GIZ43774.1 hypothetical protein CKM354_000698900 [Cercospora kikuchii]